MNPYCLQMVSWSIKAYPFSCFGRFRGLPCCNGNGNRSKFVFFNYTRRGNHLQHNQRQNRQNPNITTQFGQTQKTTLKVFPDETKPLSTALSWRFSQWFAAHEVIVTGDEQVPTLNSSPFPRWQSEVKIHAFFVFISQVKTDMVHDQTGYAWQSCQQLTINHQRFLIN